MAGYGDLLYVVKRNTAMISVVDAVSYEEQAGRGESEEALARCGGDPETAAVELDVSLRGLKRRIAALGCCPPDAISLGEGLKANLS